MPNTRRSTPRRPTPCVPSMLTRLLRLSAPLVLLALLPIAVPGLLAESAGQTQAPPPQQPPQQAGAANAPCSVAGMVAAGQARLPGVVVSVTPDGGRRGAHDVDGTRRPIPRDASRAGPLRRQGRALGVCDRHEGSCGGSAVPGAARHRDDAGLARAGARRLQPQPRSRRQRLRRRPSRPQVRLRQPLRGLRPLAHGRAARSVRRPVSSSAWAPPARAPSRAQAQELTVIDRRHAGARRAAQPAAGVHARDAVRHGDRVRPHGPDQRDAAVRPRRTGMFGMPGGHAWHARVCPGLSGGRRRRRQ